MNQTQILRSLMESMQGALKPKTSAYDTTARFYIHGKWK